MIEFALLAVTQKAPSFPTNSLASVIAKPSTGSVPKRNLAHGCADGPARLTRSDSLSQTARASGAGAKPDRPFAGRLRCKPLVPLSVPRKYAFQQALSLT